MADSNDQMTGASADDSEWIKSLVAEALLRASDEEGEPAPATPPATAESLVPPATPSTPVVPSPTPVEPPPVSMRPEQSPEPQLPTVPTPTSAADFDVVANTAPLVIGRRTAEAEIPVAEAGPGPVVASMTLDPAQLSNGAPTDGVPLPDEADPVMVEADATTEGFRSSDIRTVLEWLAVIVSALAVALLIKAYVLQAFWIPSESMETTVNKGDRILVNKVSYRLHEVRRGDLVVFKKLPGTPGDTEDLIKRAIALPGETIEVRADGRIYIWGPGETAEDALLLQEPYLDPQNEFLAGPSASDALSVDIWDESCVNQPRTPGRCTLGDNQLFMMGDNRNSSSDSRFFGPITEDLIVGRAFLRIWPLGDISSL